MSNNVISIKALVSPYANVKYRALVASEQLIGHMMFIDVPCLNAENFMVVKAEPIDIKKKIMIRWINQLVMMPMFVKRFMRH